MVGQGQQKPRLTEKSDVPATEGANPSRLPERIEQCNLLLDPSYGVVLAKYQQLLSQGEGNPYDYEKLEPSVSLLESEAYSRLAPVYG